MRVTISLKRQPIRHVFKENVKNKCEKELKTIVDALEFVFFSQF